MPDILVADQAGKLVDDRSLDDEIALEGVGDWEAFPCHRLQRNIGISNRHLPLLCSYLDSTVRNLSWVAFNTEDPPIQVMHRHLRHPHC